MKHYGQVFILVFTLALLPGLGFAKKTLGEVANPDALLKVQSFCIDTTNLRAAELGDEKKFIDKQSPPKGLLGKLPWKLVENCAQADAVVGLKFESSFQVTQAAGSGMATGAAISQSVPEATYSTQMLVTDRVSRKPLYQVKGEAVITFRDRSINSPFSKLIHDLKTLSK